MIKYIKEGKSVSRINKFIKKEVDFYIRNKNRF
jgi:hypothetical protein